MWNITDGTAAADRDQLDPGGVQVQVGVVVVVGASGGVIVVVGEEEGITVVHAELPLGAIRRRPDTKNEVATCYRMWKFSMLGMNKGG